MADWRNISDTEVDPDAPVTSELAYAFRDNVIAVTEGSPGAPKIDSIAAMSHEGIQGRVGTYAFAQHTGTGTVAFGQVVSGSDISPSAASGVPSGSLSGSWRCMGYIQVGQSDTGRRTSWLRIS